ncbi:MAG: ABC transporter permease [Alphaproteobacteria bacterium]|nr:ABC transporter permease [Alphaproteobacteria bacterium]
MTRPGPRRLTLPIQGAIGLVVFVCLWEAVSLSPLANPVLFPSPISVVPSLIRMISTGELMDHVIASGRRAILGFMCGAIPGMLMGIATARSRTLSAYLDPLLQMFRSIPALALVPFGVFWFGIGETSKILLVGWTVFFPVWLNTEAGITEVSPLIVRAAASLGASGWRLLARVYLPAALPYIFTGLKISLSAGISTLVAAELAGAVFGVGYLIQVSEQVFRIDLMLVGLLALGVGNWLLVAGFNAAIAYMAPWYGAEARRARASGA